MSEKEKGTAPVQRLPQETPTRGELDSLTELFETLPGRENAGDEPSDEERRRANVQHVALFIAILSGLVFIVYALVFFQTRAWQALGSGGITLAGCGLCFLMRSWARKKDLDHVTRGMLGTVVVLLPANVLFLGGVTWLIAAGTFALVILAGSLMLPRQRIIWAAAGGALGAGLTFGCDQVASWPRVDASQLSALKIAVPVAISLVVLMAAWRIVRTFRIGTIRTRLIVAFVAMVLLPAVAIIATSAVGGVQGGQEQVIDQLESVATLKEAKIDTWLQGLKLDLAVELASDMAVLRMSLLLRASPDMPIPQASYDAQMNQFRQTIELRRSFDELFLMNRQGKVVLSTDAEEEARVYSNQAFFRQGLVGPYVQPLSYSPSLGQLSVIVVHPFVSKEGEVLGVLAGRASLAMLNDVMVERAGLGETGETYLVGENYVLLTESRFGEQGIYVQTEGSEAAIEGEADGSGLYEGYRGETVVGVYRWLPELGVALLAEQDQAEAFRSIWTTLGVNVGVALVSVLAAVVASLFVTQSIAGPLAELGGTAAEIAAGDLEREARVRRGDEIGTLAEAFNRMTGRLRGMLRSEQEQRVHLQATINEYVAYMARVGAGDLAARAKVEEEEGRGVGPLGVLGHQLNETTENLQQMILQTREAAQGLGSAAAEILAATTQQVAGSNEQSAAISQTTTTVDEVKTIADQSVARAQEVADASQHTVEVSRTGHRAVQETIESMGQIKGRVEGIAENILTLSEQTQQIGEIIATVNELASQSNMLALNAAVEAARAGEHGKGFAVVAAEVRNLAEQSKEATGQVRAILSDIQRATNATVMATEEGTKRVEEGVQLAAQTGKAIDQLSEVIDESARAAMQMVAGGQQQASGVEQIALAMQNIHQATVQSLASTRQTEKTAQDLNELARRLTEIVEQYQL